MTGTQRFRFVMVGIAVGLVAGVLVGGAVALISPEREDAVSSLADAEAAQTNEIIDIGLGRKVDPVGVLGVVHQRMLESGGVIVLGTVDNITTLDSRVDSAIQVDQIQWQTKPHDVVAGTSVSARSGDIEPAEQAQLVDLSKGAQVVAVITGDGELLGIAELASDEDLHAIDPVPGGPLFLGAAARALAATGFPAIPGDDCEIDQHIGPNERTPLDALLTYFAELGNTTREDRIAALTAVDVEVERIIESSPELTDQITGVDVPVAINDIHRQVTAGVRSVEIRPTYPMVVELSKADRESTDVLVFTDSVTGELASWVDLAPTGWVDDAGETHWNKELYVYLEAPPTGNDVAVSVRSIDEAFDCAPTDGSEPLLTISYDSAFGSQRAVLSLSTLTVSELTTERLTSGS